jgi:hypothetical protein
MEIFVFAVVKLDILFQKFPNPMGAVGTIGLLGAVGALGMDGAFGRTGRMGCTTAGKASTADMVAPPDNDTGNGVFAADVVIFALGAATFFDVTLNDCVFLATTGVLFAQTITRSQKTTKTTAIKMVLF